MRLGHEVHLFSQDRHPERQGFVDAHRRLGRGRAARPHPARAGALYGLPAEHRPAAAGVRGRPLRGHRDAHLPRGERRGDRALRAGERRGRVRGTRARAAGDRARKPPRDGSRGARAGAPGRGALRGEDPRQRARVHREGRARALPRASARGRARRTRGARGLLAHRAEPLGGARRGGGRAAHAARAAGGGRRSTSGRSRTTRMRARSRRPSAWRWVGGCSRSSSRSCARRRRSGPRILAAPESAFARDPGAAADALAPARPGKRAAGGVRGEADREQGRRSAARRVAARARARPGRAARGGWLRLLSRGARRARGGALARRSGRGTAARRARERARGRRRRRGAGALAALPARLPGRSRGGRARVAISPLRAWSPSA